MLGYLPFDDYLDFGLEATDGGSKLAARTKDTLI